MYSWGCSNIANYFASIDCNNKPKKLKCFEKSDIAHIQLNRSLSIVLLKDGSVHTFGKQNELLGHSSNASKVTALETILVADVVVGEGHFFAIDENGKVYGWGRNTKGQLGLRGSDYYSVPKLIKLPTHKISMVACGDEHSLFLTYASTIWSAGSNDFGQLGLGDGVLKSAEPRQIVSLQGIPFLQVVAGSWHSLAVTISGTVFGWGRNDCGQLGVGDMLNKNAPTLLKSLRSQNVKYVAAGSYHTAALTVNGGVFTFGSNQYGQLGHGFPVPDSGQTDVVIPRQVFELMGNTVTQLACGGFHTLTFVFQPGLLYSFGDNRNGQLGTQNTTNEHYQFLPNVVDGPWNTQVQASSSNSFEHLSCSHSMYIKEISAGGSESLALTTSERINAIDYREMPNHKQILTLSNDLIAKLESLAPDAKITSDIGKYLEMIIGSPACLNASFLESDHHRTNSNYHGVNLMSVRLAFSKICNCSCKDVYQKIIHYLQRDLIPSLSSNPPDVEALRLYLFMPECPFFSKPELYMLLTLPFARRSIALTGGASKVLDNWYSTLEPNFFYHQVSIYKDCVKHLLDQPASHQTTELQNNLFGALEFLSKLNRVNGIGEKYLIPFEKFYLPDINRLVNLENDYERWSKKMPHNVIICNYPFLLNSIAKTSLLQIDATYQMRVAFNEAQTRNIASFLGLNNDPFMELPVLELEVRRRELVHDTLSKLAEVDMRSLKKPLVIKFEGEDGQDAGGVRKEFFMLILKEVVDPKYGMFRYYEDSRLIWFSDFELETEMMYFLVGLLCGLAIYNNTIIDICFPLALYKKLLGFPVVLSDLEELDPAVFRGMQQLLQYTEIDGGLIEDVFCLNFAVCVDNFGEIRTTDLVPGGSEISVTKDNRAEYVEKYLDYLFNWSVRSQYEAFSKGFHKVCGGQILQLFRPTELMEMVVGNQNYNWEEFEKQATYKGDYYRYHSTINYFWQVFHSFTLDEKKEFLLFLTGCNKVPINGVKITIQPVKTSENHLPVAHTCFNLLDLPYYSSAEILKSKLQKAMQNNQGFHLV